MFVFYLPHPCINVHTWLKLDYLQFCLQFCCPNKILLVDFGRWLKKEVVTFLSLMDTVRFDRSPKCSSPDTKCQHIWLFVHSSKRSNPDSPIVASLDWVIIYTFLIICSITQSMANRRTKTMHVLVNQWIKQYRLLSAHWQCAFGAINQLKILVNWFRIIFNLISMTKHMDYFQK